MTMDGFCLRRYSSGGYTNVLVGQFKPHHDKENVFVLDYTVPFLNFETESVVYQIYPQNPSTTMYSDAPIRVFLFDTLLATTEHRDVYAYFQLPAGTLVTLYVEKMTSKK
jgi:hypothetical protein